MRCKAGLFFCLLFFAQVAFAGSILLINDSDEVLKAVVKGSRGDVLGGRVIAPHSSFRWSDTFGQKGFSGKSSNDMKRSNYSQTPYSVTWFREEGGERFSHCTNILSGATVRARCREM